MGMVTGTAYWASVIKPNTKFDPTWVIELVVSAADAKRLQEESEGVRDSKKDAPFKIAKDEERGGYAVRFTQKVEKADGTKNQAPRVIDADGFPWDERLIGNGSKVTVLYNFYRSEFNGKAWLKGGLRGVRVEELVPYGGDEAEEAFFNPKGKTPSKKAEDDEVPFDDDIPDFR